MQVKNIECQIAQAQLRRYLTGEELPNAVVKDLETHLRHCPECMEFAEQQRESLKSTLAGKITGRPARPMPTPRQEPTKQELKQAIETGHAAVETPMDILGKPDSAFATKRRIKRNSNYKTLGYSLALAIVLLLMSTVFKDPTKIFGPRAATTNQDTPPTSSVQNAEPQNTEPKQPEATSEQTKPQVPESTSPAAPPTKTAQASDQPKETAVKTDGFIIADSVDGTKFVKSAPAKPKQPADGTGTIKVYPPDKK